METGEDGVELVFYPVLRAVSRPAWALALAWGRVRAKTLAYERESKLGKTYASSQRIGWTIRSGEYDLIACAAVGAQIMCERSAPCDRPRHSQTRVSRHYVCRRSLTYQTERRHGRKERRASVATHAVSGRIASRNEGRRTREPLLGRPPCLHARLDLTSPPSWTTTYLTGPCAGSHSGAE